MPLHPSLVTLTVACALLLAVADTLLLCRKGDPPAGSRLAPLVAHILLMLFAVTSAATGQSEAARIPISDSLKPLLIQHEAWATRLTFLLGAALLVRLGTWKRKDRRIDGFLALVSVLVAIGLFMAGRLGGKMVFEHGAGVQVESPTDSR